MDPDFSLHAVLCFLRSSPIPCAPASIGGHAFGFIPKGPLTGTGLRPIVPGFGDSSRRGQKTNLRVWIWQSGPCIRLMRAKPWLGLIVEAGAIEEELSSRLVRWLTAPKI